MQTKRKGNLSCVWESERERALKAQNQKPEPTRPQILSRA